MTRKAIVKHLGVLEQAGLVEARKLGREVQFSVRSERLESTARWTHGVAAAWDQRLDAIMEMSGWIAMMTAMMLPGAIPAVCKAVRAIDAMSGDEWWSRRHDEYGPSRST